KTIMLQLKFEVKQGEKNFDLFWIVPQADFESMFSKFSAPASNQIGAFTSVLECFAKEMKVNMSVILGGAELSFNQMSNLAAGDVVMLDQKISDPLPVWVEDAEKFKAWPGKLGKSQAIKISSTV
ncbi:FliM/FliN family flagellar motor C-terminal domain-containing protein, partial [Pirellulaceae bacterium]|nr:FliM/FliN family flagellar motor C-terminal domain-containing protein [Pirellulaceae bacterium]